MRTLSIPVVACVLLCVLSCSPSNQEAIRGTWQVTDEPYKDWRFEFRHHADSSEKIGSVTFMMKDTRYEGVSMTGDGQRVMATFRTPDQAGQDLVFGFLISGDSLTLTHTQNHELATPLRLQRVK